MATFVIQLPAHVEEAIRADARRAGQTPEQQIARWLEREADKREREEVALDRIRKLRAEQPVDHLSRDWIVNSIREDRER